MLNESFKDTTTLIDLINFLLPDQRIMEDAARILNEEIQKGGFADLDSENQPSIDESIEVINKKFVCGKYEIGFGNHYACRVAIGGVVSYKGGAIVPKYFFATLYYTDDLRLITVDFHDDLRL